MATSPRFTAGREGGTAPAQGLAAVTPNNAADLPVSPTRGLYVGVSGDVSVVTAQGDTVLLKGLAAGILHPLAVVRVRSTGTTATDIVAAY